MAKAVPSSLAGKRVVITRSASQSEALAKELVARGVFPIVLPLITFADPEDFGPLDTAIAQIEQFDWMIFTSAQAVRAVAARGNKLGHVLGGGRSKLRITAVGPVTAEAVKQAGMQVEFVARTHSAVALANELGEQLRGQRVLLPRSDRANPEFPAALQRHGAQIIEVIAYQTLRPSEIEQEKLTRIDNGEADAVLFFSPSAVQHFVESVGTDQFHKLQDRLAITAVGPVTAKALREAGIQRIVLAEDTTEAAVIGALEGHFADPAKQSAAGVKRG